MTPQNCSLVVASLRRTALVINGIQMDAAQKVAFHWCKHVLNKSVQYQNDQFLQPQFCFIPAHKWVPVTKYEMTNRCKYWKPSPGISIQKLFFHNSSFLSRLALRHSDCFLLLGVTQDPHDPLHSPEHLLGGSSKEFASKTPLAPTQI